MSRQIDEIERQVYNLSRRVLIIQTQFRCLYQHLGLDMERGQGQMGSDDCVGQWDFRNKCKECGR